ncbi:MAG TPA: efflux RND transporter periplasmic adaptor subunit [Rhizomicrobium sp.]|nr:efflux RND transporter periplasmic adaptor subunit [Rhizomicrobium sp.]
MKRLVLLALLVLASCGPQQKNPWLGYVEGEDAFIAPPQPGWITHLAVQRGQWVKAGDLLFTLDDTHEKAVLDQDLANLDQAKAQLMQEQSNHVYAQTQLARQTGLARDHAGVPVNYDQALLAYEQSDKRVPQLEAQIRQSEGTVADAQYQLSQRRVVAYTEGRVEDIYYRQGEYAPASTPVISLLPPANIYVRFFVPETELQHVKLGQLVAVSCDSCATNLSATVTFIAQQEEFTAPDIFSVGNREKLVFKAEARAPGGLKLNPGQPVEVRSPSL